MERLTEKNDVGTHYFQKCFEKCGGIGTNSKWDRFMFEKISHDVLATVENEKGNRYVRLAHTIDGKWEENIQIRKLKVIAWMPLPEPYRQHIAEGGENNDI